MEKKYFTIKEAAELLGVTPLTLRNWDKSGKLSASRNPINNYRVYRREDIEDIVGELEFGNTEKNKNIEESASPSGKQMKRKLIVRHIDDVEKTEGSKQSNETRGFSTSPATQADSHQSKTSAWQTPPSDQPESGLAREGSRTTSEQQDDWFERNLYSRE